MPGCAAGAIEDAAAAGIAPLTVRIPGAVRLTGLSRTRVYALLKAGEIEMIKVGGNTLVVVESPRNFVDRERANGAAAHRESSAAQPQ